MNPIFNREGSVVGWLEGDAVIDRDGRRRAFVSNDGLYDNESHYLGRTHNGFFWDQNGKAIAFIEGAKGGPLLPRIKPIPSEPVIEPSEALPSLPPETPAAPPYKGLWSKTSWEDFLEAATMARH
jgi:hypothetical protein